jgi:hypothetical protein
MWIASVKCIVDILIDFKGRLNGNQWAREQIFPRHDRKRKRPDEKIAWPF